MSILQQEIRKRLAVKQLSVHALEKAASLKVGAVQNIMRGRSKNPGIDTLKAIAAVLECTIEELLGRELSPSAAHSIFSSPSERVVAEKGSNHWHAALYLEIVQLLTSWLQKENKSITFPAATYMLNEVYEYALLHREIDSKFVEWIYHKAMKKEHVS